MHYIYLIHEFHNLSWITEINELFHDILIYWDAPVHAETVLINAENSLCCLVFVYKANSDTLPLKNWGKNVSKKKIQKKEMNTFKLVTQRASEKIAARGVIMRGN